MGEEGDAPSTEGGVEGSVKRLARAAFSIDGAVQRLAELIEAFKNNLTLRSASMHRVAITVGGAMFWFIAVLLIIVGVGVGLDISERSAQRRQWDANTATLQREWQRDTAKIAESNERLYLEYQKAEREARVKEQQLMDLSALQLRDGVRQPGDTTNGPAGNLNYHKRSK
jgi:hypothetical protein